MTAHDRALSGDITPLSSTQKPANPEFEKAVRESFAKQGLMGTIGAWLVEVAPGQVVVELPFSARVAQQQGLFHGAVIGALGDTAGGYAAMSLMPSGSEVATVEYKINFVAPAKGGLLRAEGQVVTSGRSLTVVRVDIHSAEGDKTTPCAIMLATMMRAPRSGQTLTRPRSA